MTKWSEEAKKAKSKTAFPCFSLYFPTVPLCFEVWKTLPTFAGRNVR